MIRAGSSPCFAPIASRSRRDDRGAAGGEDHDPIFEKAVLAVNALVARPDEGERPTRH